MKERKKEMGGAGIGMGIGIKGWGYANFCFEVISGLDEME